MIRFSLQLSRCLGLPDQVAREDGGTHYKVVSSLAEGAVFVKPWTAYIQSPSDVLRYCAPIYLYVLHEPEFFAALRQLVRDDELDPSRSTYSMAICRIMSALSRLVNQRGGSPTVQVRPLDPLGVWGECDDTDWRIMPKSYFEEAKKNKLELYRRYLLRNSTYGARTDSTSYQTEVKSLQNVTYRVAEIITLIRGIPATTTLHFPGDGIGVGAMASLELGRAYVSSEPNPIGALALRLGIIQYDYTAEDHVRAHVDGVFVYSNLSQYVNLEELFALRPSISVDVANPEIRGASTLDTKGVLKANTELLCGADSIVLPRVNLPDVSTIRHPNLQLRDNDSVLRDHLERSGLVVDSGEVAVRNISNVREDTDYIVSERKIARARPHGPGKTCYRNGFTYTYGDATRIRIMNRELAVVSDNTHTPVTVLSKDYDMLNNHRIRVYVGYNPVNIRRAYADGRLVPVYPINVQRSRDSFSVIIARVRDEYDVSTTDRGEPSNVPFRRIVSDVRTKTRLDAFRRRMERGKFKWKIREIEYSNSDECVDDWG